MITGPAGIGKTSLADEIGRRSATDVLVVWGRCWEGGGAPPLWPWTQVLRELLGRLGPARIEEVVGPRWSYIDMIAAGTPGGQMKPTEAWSLYDAVTSSVVDLSRDQPLMIVLDDLHAADEPSLTTLRLFASAVRAGAVLVVGTYRDTDVSLDPISRRNLVDIERDAYKIQLRGLSDEEISAYLEAVTGRPPFEGLVDTLLRATEGNPLFVQEFVRLLMADVDLHRADESTGFLVPATVHGVMQKRLDHLGEDTLEVLRIASVLGREFQLNMVAELAEKDATEISDVLEEAVEARILERVGALGDFRFTHILARESIYEDLGTAERMRIHAKIAGSIERSHAASSLDRYVMTLAHHYFKAAQAGDVDKMVSYNLAAAQQTESMGAAKDAVRFYKRTLRASDLGSLPADVRASITAKLASIQSDALAGLGELAPSRDRHPPDASEECNLVREADFWSVSYKGKTARIRDSKGLRYLGELLAHPNQEFHVMDLVALVDAVPAVVTATREEGLPKGAMTDAGEMIDATAHRRYKARLEDLAAEIDEAVRFNDVARAGILREEFEAITAELARAVGLGGRRRKAGSPSERARLSVRKAMRTAIRSLERAHPDLAEHLESSISTGTFCSYRPAPAVRIRWRTSPPP